MMTPEYLRALASGAQAVAMWSGLLDRINVFPVADGDTGANLMTSFAPLEHDLAQDRDLHRELLLAARGNSGNIASQFLAGLLSAPTTAALPQGASRGRALAWEAIPDPRAGTMLSVFDTLAEQLSPQGWALSPEGLAPLLTGLEQAVRRTPEQLPILAKAGVVDSGALGMFIFLERFLRGLLTEAVALPSVAQRFGPLLQLQPGVALDSEEGFCVDAVVRSERDVKAALVELGALGNSAVVHSHDGLLKVHLHTADPEQVRQTLGQAGEVMRFSSDDLGEQTREFANPEARPAIHLITDAAGSLTADDAARLGITLLSSYIQCGGHSVPESQMVSGVLYEAMRQGERVSTAQASVQQRQEGFAQLLVDHPQILYITVGSAFSGIHEVASAWQQRQDPQGRLRLIDSGAASGKLGVAVRATAEFAHTGRDPDTVVDYARRAVVAADELIFLDRLKYLAAGGRLSKTASFFGEALRLKPIVTPAADGARKVGTVRSQAEQLSFAWKRLASLPPVSGHYLVLLQHTDNEAWLRDEMVGQIERRLPGARVIVRPMSLTSGAHMGPGTWALAYLGLTADGMPQ